MAEEEEVVGATCAHHLNLYRTGPERRSLSEARRKEARVFGEVVNGSNVAGLHSLERELLGDSATVYPATDVQVREGDGLRAGQ